MDSEPKKFIYSVPVTEKKEGESPIYRHPDFKDKLYTLPPEIKSLGDTWDQIMKKFSERKVFQTMTYGEFDSMARKIGSWMMDNGHKMILLYAKNSEKWLATDIACWNYGVTNAPLYDTLGPETFDYITKLTQGTLIFTVSDLLDKVIGAMEKDKSNVKEIIMFDNECPVEKKQKLQGLGLKVRNFEELANYQIKERPEFDLDTALTLMFTSGTTGVPKGVKSTHRMVACQIAAVQLNNSLNFHQDSVHMSYLPIAHGFERYQTYFLFASGSQIMFMRGPVTEITKQFARIRPTFFNSVPRLFNRFYPMLKNLYEKQGSKQKVQAVFGGRIQTMLSASAPVSPLILSFFREAFDIKMQEAYGQTETSAGSFITNKDHINPGHTGGPIPAIEFKLVDVPEMDYYSHNDPPRGEICERGEPIFSEYYKRPDATEETVDKDGWNHSGDVGELCPDGGLKIIDRKKNIYKLSQGEYIAPEKIENIYARVKFINEVFVYGDSTKDYNVAFIYPNFELMPFVTKSLNIEETDPAKLCENEDVRKFIFDEILKQGKTDGLLGFEQPKKIKLLPIPFVQVGILTDTMKLQRNTAKKVLKEQIEQLYAS